MATILTKRSNTASSVPVAGDLTNSTSGAELAVNTADKRLFVKDSGGTVVELGTNPSAFSNNPTFSAGTANGVAYLNGSKVLTTGSALTFDGSAFGVIGSGNPTFNLSGSAGGYTSIFNMNAAGGGASKINAVGGTNALILQTNTVDRATLDSSGNLGLGVTPVAGYGKSLQLKDSNGATSAIIQQSIDVDFQRLDILNNALPPAGGYTGSYNYTKTGASATIYRQDHGAHFWFVAPSGTAGNAISFTQAMSLTAAGELLIGDTATSSFFDGKLNVAGRLHAKLDNGSNPVGFFWNTNTSANNGFVGFYTESSATLRGSITYNRAGGLTVYNTTSDYRAKDIFGPVVDSGSVIDSVPVYMGRMKGATQDRPMFIAHETPPYAHTGEKDAVDKDGNPVYQQMDASSLVPVMWAELQSLRARVAALESN